MEVGNRILSSMGMMTLFMAFILTLSFPFSMAQSPSPAPAPAPTSDGTAIDQGIAYVLMLVALAVTYLVH